MISIWHLFWIIPLSAALGMFLMGIVSINKLKEDE